VNYEYKIIFNNEDGIIIIEDDKENISDKWLLNTIINYSHVWKGNPSFLRTQEWLSNNHAELLL
jgi:hypothetical protein